MLTCKVGNTIINCFDGQYDKYTLKEWSDKSKLICPDCGKPYEYCHGRIVPPYFRHKEKEIECGGIYSEPETVEHINGKLLLYKWLLKIQDDDIIQNLKLEAYIPETKQRPDIYFEKDNQRYVIEFQCSPIATEYLERHELYQLAKVNDIWVLGLEKYNITVSDSGIIRHSEYFKTIEKHSQYHLDVKSNSLIINSDVVADYLPYNSTWLSNYYYYDVNNFCINNAGRIVLKDDTIDLFIEQDMVKHGDMIKAEIQKNREISIITDVVNELNNRYKAFDKGIYSFYSDDSGYKGKYKYKYKIRFDIQSMVTQYTFFIKENSVDCCDQYSYTRPFRGKKGGIGWEKCYGYRTLYSKSFEAINGDIIKNFILDKVCGYIRSTKYGL